jgi:hypothetical protein
MSPTLNPLPLLLVLIIWGLLAFALYWVIRLAVRHALQDVTSRRGTMEYLLSGAEPPRRPAAPPAD